MTAESKLNPWFADRLIKLLTQADIRPEDLATRIDVPLEVVEACLKGKVPEAEVLYETADRYGRIVGWVTLPDRTDLNSEWTVHAAPHFNTGSAIAP